jgi:hypothetical protein
VKNAILGTVFRRQHEASLASIRPFLQGTEHGSPTNAYSMSSVADAAIELSATTPKFLDTEVLAASTSTQSVATISTELCHT